MECTSLLARHCNCRHHVIRLHHRMLAPPRVIMVAVVVVDQAWRELKKHEGCCWLVAGRPLEQTESLSEMCGSFRLPGRLVLQLAAMGEWKQQVWKLASPFVGRLRQNRRLADVSVHLLSQRHEQKHAYEHDAGEIVCSFGQHQSH